MNTSLGATDTTANGVRAVTLIEPPTGSWALDLPQLWQYRGLLYFLVWRELKVRYKQAALGATWVVLQPVLAVTVFTVVFGMLARLPSDGVPYALFAFAGLLPWMYFADAARRTSTCLVADSELIRKVYFPRLVIPLANVVAPLVDLGVAFLVFLVVMLWHGVAPTWAALLAIPLVLITVLLALAFGLWMGPINVRYRDVTHTIPFVLQVWMYATPIVYPLSLVPDRWQPLFAVNPMVGIVEGFRWALLDTPPPAVLPMVISATVIIAVLASGLYFFRRMERSFADII